MFQEENWCMQMAIRIEKCIRFYSSSQASQSDLKKPITDAQSLMCMMHCLFKPVLYFAQTLPVWINNVLEYEKTYYKRSLKK